MMYVILIVVIAIIAIAILTARPISPVSDWRHTFLETQFSAEEVFTSVAESIQIHKMSKVIITRLAHLESHIFSDARIYQRIAYGDYVIDVCCAAFGTGCYVSWWLGQKDPGLLPRIPFLNTISGTNPKYQSYHKLDTAYMFRDTTHKIILGILEEMSASKGIRPLSEIERQPKDVLLKCW